MSPNAGEKLLPNDLAFTENDVFGTINTAPLSPREELLAARMADDNFLSNSSFSYRPPFAEHHDSITSTGWESLRRAVEALHILEKRQSCPTTMNSCDYIGAANKCCLSNEVCVKVVDEHVGNVACCPKGAACSGAVAACPSGTTSCDAELSGGCCIPGYVCQGVGCKYSSALLRLVYADRTKVYQVLPRRRVPHQLRRPQALAEEEEQARQWYRPSPRRPSRQRRSLTGEPRPYM